MQNSMATTFDCDAQPIMLLERSRHQDDVLGVEYYIDAKTYMEKMMSTRVMNVKVTFALVFV